MPIFNFKVAEDLKLESRPEYRRAFMNSTRSDIPIAVCKETKQISSRLLSVRNANLLLKLPRKTEQKSCVIKDEIVEAMVIAPL